MDLKDLTLGELLNHKGELIRRYNNYEKPLNYYNQLEAINDAIKSKEKQNLPIDWAEEMKKVIGKLENLKKWDPSTGDGGPYAGQIDWEEDNKFGCWIRLEDVEEIIKELKSKNQ